MVSLGHVVTVYYFEELTDHHFIILLMMYESCNFFISLPTLASFFLNFSHPGEYYVLSCCDFDLHFPDVETPFMCFLAICIVTLVSLCCKFFVYFLKTGIF